MSVRRRAAAPRLIDWTGERCVPWTPDIQVAYEHFHRYLWAARLVRGRRVLDLGSGEGFGAAILAESAEYVLGVDIDSRSVEHSRLNYQATNLTFEAGSALDLTAHESGSFDVVVAFEIIEHIREQRQVIAEVGRLLAEDGVLVISTPDRRIYSDAEGRCNPFHERELELEEFLGLLREEFPHLSTWGQRTITGSHLNALADTSGAPHAAEADDFFLERSGEEWNIARDPVPVYFVSLASKAPLAAQPRTSTLADCGLELMRVQEQVAAIAVGEKKRVEAERINLEHESRHRERSLELRLDETQAEISRRDQDILRQQKDVATAHSALQTMAVELDTVRQMNQRTEESVIWQAFQRTRAALYGQIGEQSLLARALGRSLRMAGRAVVTRPRARATAGDHEAELLVLPQYGTPKVSLIIPTHAHPDLTLACLRSIYQHTAPVSYEVIVVDDAADHATKRVLRKLSGVRLIRNRTNLGYLRSIERGAAIARGDWLVLCNNDTEMRPGWLAAMLACAESAEDIGIVTPKYIYPDGTLNEAGGIIWRDGTGVNYGRGDMPNRPQYEYRRETDYGSGAALMVDADLWRQIGGFDERFLPMYYEDTDICFAAREHGKKVMYEPEAVVVHVEGATAGRDVTSGAKRYQEQNRPKFVAKWSHRLETEHAPPTTGDIRALAGGRRRQPHVLLVDYRVPTWDRDAGSLRMLGIVRALLALGARVTLLPDNPTPLEPYTRALREMGVEVLCSPFDPHTELPAVCSDLDTAILCRPTIASRWLDSIREFAPLSRVAYDTVDLHWLREARRLAVSESFAVALDNGAQDLDPEALAPKVKALRELELAMVRATDITLVVTDAERMQVELHAPGANVIVLPTVHDVDHNVPPASTRSGILFIGGFAHTPNIDAAIKLVREVMPALWQELGDIRLVIAGGDVPPQVEGLASSRVEVAGWVEDLQPLLEQSRVMLAPITYGAGIKGKITQCLAAGLPVVTTTIGGEGIDPNCLLVEDDASAFAAAAVRLYRDDELWAQLSDAGQAFIGSQCSPACVAKRLEALLGVTTPSAIPAVSSATIS